MVSAIGVGGYTSADRLTNRKPSASCAPPSITDQLPRQLLGLQRWRERAAHGKSAARRLPRQSLSHDKIDGRSKDSATQQIEESLRRLQTDRIDLMQFHEVIRMSDPERVFGPDGRWKRWSRRNARADPLHRLHRPQESAIHLRMLEVARQHGFTFDAVQMPLNVMDAHYDSFTKQVVPVLVEHDIGVLGMKPWRPVRPGEWHRNAIECLHYAMKPATSVVITGLATPSGARAGAARRSHLSALSEAAVAGLLVRTADAARAQGSTSCTRRAIISMGPTRTLSGWGDSRLSVYLNRRHHALVLVREDVAVVDEPADDRRIRERDDDLHLASDGHVDDVRCRRPVAERR